MDPLFQISNNDFFDEGKFENVQDENVIIPECEGIPRSSWSTNVITLQNEHGLPVAEGICHNVNSDLVIGSSGPLGDSLVMVQISKSLGGEDVPDDWRYSLRAWPIERVFLNGTSLRDHEVQDKYNR